MQSEVESNVGNLRINSMNAHFCHRQAHVLSKKIVQIVKCCDRSPIRTRYDE